MTEPTSSSSAKRQISAAQNTDSPEPKSKRGRDETRGSATSQLFESFVRRYNVEMSKEQFVGLCAYLCAVAELGYTIPSRKVDAFVYKHTDFGNYLEFVERQRVVESTVQVPAYHQWFLEQLSMSVDSSDSSDTSDVQILDVQALRAVMMDNPYTFLRTKLSLECIGKIGQREQHLENFHQL